MTLSRADGTAPAARTAVLLVNLGTPSAPTAGAVRRFLAEFLHDYRVVDASRWWWCPLLHFVILPLRSPKVARKYAAIWRDDGSPLLALSRLLASGLQQALPEFDVALAMRYGEPSVGATLRGLRARGMTRLVVLPLYPQYSGTTTASVLDAVSAELATWANAPELEFINDYPVDPAWVDAVAASVTAHWATHGRGERLLFSFHGIPQRYVDAGDPYARQCEAGARAIAARLGLPDEDGGAWKLTYQSRFGREPWLGPATVDALQQLGATRAASVDVVCPGFAVDCLETLEEIAVEGATLFTASGGGELRYVPALNDSPAHVAALAALVRRHAIVTETT
ncbi:MAG: ferrochelatase [Arenimonas sp.]